MRQIELDIIDQKGIIKRLSHSLRENQQFQKINTMITDFQKRETDLWSNNLSNQEQVSTKIALISEKLNDLQTNQEIKIKDIHQKIYDIDKKNESLTELIREGFGKFSQEHQLALEQYKAPPGNLNQMDQILSNVREYI